MSEMIKYKDRSITLGTCQNLYYATYADLKNNVEHFTKLARRGLFKRKKRVSVSVSVRRRKTQYRKLYTL